MICEHFSDRVEYFSTINEPQIITRMGYSTGQHAPGLTLPDDTVLEILHSLAKAHAAAVRAMRKCAKRKIKMPEWRNWQTHTTQNRAGNHVGSSPTLGTRNKETQIFSVFFYF